MRCIDADRVGLYGVQYGGYLVGMTLISDSEHVFQCGAMAQPITTWSAYPSIPAERYMGRFRPSQYENSSLLAGVAKLRKRIIYLVHGERDLEYEMSISLAEELRKANVHFEQHVSWSGCCVFGGCVC